MFEKASRLKLRFATSRGEVGIEDLWDLPLTSERGHPNLNDVARGLSKQLKSGDDVSFVDPAPKGDGTLQLKMDIVLRVIAVLVEERKAAADAHGKAETKKRILAILAGKEDEELQGKSKDELRTLLETM